MHDAAVWGLLRIRRGGLRIATDEEEDEWRPLSATKSICPPDQYFGVDLRTGF
jgi:hypothetical protein